LARTREAGDAFFAYLTFVIEMGAANQGLADALAGGGFDIEAAATHSQHDMVGALRQLLTAAQRAGTVRADIDPADVKALITGCLARERVQPDPVARQRMIDITCAGLRAIA
jgi:hypothetical protein